MKAGDLKGNAGSRVRWVDKLRGITVISMVLFHGMWDLVWIFGLRAPWYTGLPGYVWQQSICWTFLLLSGFSFRLGHHPLRRGLQVSALGLLVMAVTNLFMPEDRVVFGVLTCIGACMLLTAAAERIVFAGRNGEAAAVSTEAAGFVLCAAAFFLTRNVNIGWLGFECIRLAALPAGLYRNLATAFFGFPPADFFSTDYFSLIPWWFLYLCGYFLFGIWKSAKQRETGDKAGDTRTAGPLTALFSWIGRHALLIYALHQPLLMLVFTAAEKIAGGALGQ